MQRAAVIEQGWMTTEEAMEELQRSQRTIQKLAKRGEIKWKTRPNDGAGRPIRIYARADVQRIAQFGAQTSEEPRTRAPKTTAVAKAKDEKLQRALETVEIVGQMVAAMRAESSAQMERWKGDREDARERFEILQEQWKADHALRLAEFSLRQAPAPRPWIPVEEAAEISGMTVGFIRDRIRDEKIVAVRGGDRGELRVHRGSLMEFRG